MEKIDGVNLTEGSISKKIISFAIPLLFGYILYTGYNIVDMIWVGNLLGKDAVAASSVSFVLIYILISLASGASTGTAVLIARYYGAKKYDKVEKVASNSYFLSIIISIILTVIGLCSYNLVLKFVNVTGNIFNLASGYLRICLFGFIFMYMFFLAIAILRGIGDTMSSLVFLVISSVVNIVLDPFLISGIGPFKKLGLNGAAYATVIAQAIAVVIGLLFIGRKNKLLKFDPRKFIPDKQIMMDLIKLSFPTAMQQVLLSVGISIVSSYVNSFGKDVTAGYGVATKIDSIVTMVVMALSAATTSITGQLIGAKKEERVKEVFRSGIIISIVPALLVTVLSLLIPEQILSLFVPNKEVLEIGASYLRIVSLGYMAVTATSILTGIFSGAGKTFMTMVFTIVQLWLIRIPITSIASKTSLNYKGIWIAILISNVSGLIINMIFYFWGGWKKTTVKSKNIVQ
ncbi:MATE family efflux transporter [Anaeromicropila populeti]|uniref:Putative efflux protein, MATE family n=1 Tax=Anaeromicropila populeti TaxID=37658 RepID=A0A1I6IZP1_9FIRM|nr:MATE family efflux transporter [Anaeromicropila populeti]SFR72159.1 putative efflux protein, MATE family [Anaeromicropila populeti]